MTIYEYTEDELEAIESLKGEARLMGISIDYAIEDKEPLVILQQILDEATIDKYYYSYGY